MYLILAGANTIEKRWRLSSEPLIIGRGTGCDVRLGDTALSRKHLKLWIDSGVIRFHDLGSSNATLVNGAPLDSGTLRPGDVVSLGSTVFRLVDEVDDQEQDNTGSTTPLTISLEMAAFTRASDDELLALPTHRTIHELHDLFMLGRELGQMERMSELSSRLEGHLSEVFEPGEVCIALSYSVEQPLVFPGQAGSEDSDVELQHVLEEAVETGRGIIKTSRRGPSGERELNTLLACPLVHAGESLGGFAFRGAMSKRTYAEDDLQYALGIAAIVASHIRAVMHVEQLQRDNRMLRQQLGASTEMLGSSPAMQDVKALIQRFAKGRLPVLILGETGTGKELAARMIHEHSLRHNGPYVVVNCAAIPEDLFESEMYGHEKGAFTGAASQRLGRFEEANGGTLFLDEVGELAPTSQARLLRVIETGTLRRVGGARDMTVDVRVIAATNRTITPAGSIAGMRPDLFHRLSGLVVELPPLRQRKDDIPQLAEFFVSLFAEDQYAALSPTREVQARLMEWDWPGNVRELRSCIARAIAIAGDRAIEPDDLFFVGSPTVPQPNQTEPPSTSLADLERDHIAELLRQKGGNIRATAQALGISRTTLYKKIDDLDIPN